MRSESQNTSVHAVALSLLFDCVNSGHLPDDGTQKCFADCQMKELLELSVEEERCTQKRYNIFLGKMLCEHFPAFEFLSSVVPPQTPSQYQAEMKSESVVIPLAVLMKDETKFAEVVDVLDQLEVWVHGISSRAGICASPP